MKEDENSGRSLMEELEEARRRIASLEESLIEHQEMLKALQEIEELYRFHFSYTRDVLYCYDNQFRIQSVSPNIETILGYKPEELIGRSFQDLGMLDKADLGKAVDNALTVLSGRTVMFSTYTFIAKDGTRLFGEVSGTPLIHDGRVTGVISVARDVTERVKARDALRISEERYRLVVENSHEVIFVLQDGKMRFVNRKALELSGYSQEELTSRHGSFFIHPDDLKTVAGENRRLTSGEKLSETLSFRVFDSKRNIHWVEANAVCISWEGRPATLVFLLDVTERKRMEEEKKRLENDLAQVHKMDALGRFAGGIAHDLNNILYPIIIDSEWLLEEMAPGTPSHDVMKQVLTAAYRQRDLVRQILSFSRQNGQKAVPIKIPRLVKETITFVRSMLPSTIEIRQHIDLPSDTILGDPTQIQQVVMNLMRNAADSLESQRGAIDVTLENTYLDPASPHSEMKAGPYIKIAVRDEGCGMAPEVMDRIFEPFFTTKAAGKGCGMGLSVVHGVLKSHGGAITVESEPGKGSLFSVFLPVYHERYPKEEPCPENHPLPKGKGRILVVDDEKTILSSMHRVLEESGYSVTAFEDAVEALDVFSRDPGGFDLVITDLTMPGMTGIELSKKLLALRSDLPVILSTGYSDVIDEREMNSLGIREMIMKPSNIVDLKTAVRRVLEN